MELFHFLFAEIKQKQNSNWVIVMDLLVHSFSSSLHHHYHFMHFNFFNRKISSSFVGRSDSAYLRRFPFVSALMVYHLLSGRKKKLEEITKLDSDVKTRNEEWIFAVDCCVCVLVLRNISMSKMETGKAEFKFGVRIRCIFHCFVNWAKWMDISQAFYSG